MNDVAKTIDGLLEADPEFIQARDNLNELESRLDARRQYLARNQKRAQELRGEIEGLRQKAAACVDDLEDPASVLRKISVKRSELDELEDLLPSIQSGIHDPVQLRFARKELGHAMCRVLAESEYFRMRREEISNQIEEIKQFAREWRNCQLDVLHRHGVGEPICVRFEPPFSD